LRRDSRPISLQPSFWTAACGHLSCEVLDGQFFALIVRLVGNAMVQLIRDEQVVWFVRQRCCHVTPRRASLNEKASAETGRRKTARQSTHRNLRHSLEDLVQALSKGLVGLQNYASAQLHERSGFFAQLSANCFSSCSCLCLLDRIFEHQFSELMFDDHCRRKFDFSSEPVRAHWALL
jgi:hypothetical protein